MKKSELRQLIKEEIGKVLKENENGLEFIANKYYNKWLKEYDPYQDFGDSTTFSGENDDIINGNGYEDELNGVKGYTVDEAASVFIDTDRKKINSLKDESDDYKLFKEGDKYIIILW
jgi:hypothetical protein